MRYFKNRGKEFEAVQFNRTNFEEVWNFTEGNVSEFSVKSEELGDAYCLLRNTDYGDIQLREGDYVIKDVQNRFSGMKPEVFERTNNMVPSVVGEAEPSVK